MIALQPIFEALLAEGVLVHVNLNPQHPGALVPEQFRKLKTLVLTLGLNLAKPIPDLSSDADGIGATLSFGGRPFHCVIPWDSIYAMEGENTALVVFSRPVKVTEVTVQAEKRRGLKLVD